MQFLREYASGIIVVSVLAVLLENILPNTHHKKYINTVIGLIVLLVIASPLSHLTEFRNVLVLPENLIDDSDLSEQDGKSLVTEEFERRLADTLQREVEKKCATQVTISVHVSTNDNHQISGIEEIMVYPINEDICRILSEASGADEKIIHELKE